MNSRKFLVLSLVLFWIVCVAFMVGQVRMITEASDLWLRKIIASEICAGMLVGAIVSFLAIEVKKNYDNSIGKTVLAIAIAMALIVPPFFTGSLIMPDVVVVMMGFIDGAVVLMVPEFRKPLRQWLGQKYAG